ncbi:hypothetical protein BH23CHL7_BH23CHL7_14450 [soil metagenome]
MHRPPPFEPLPVDRRAARLRGLRDGLIIAGWMACALVPLMVVPINQSFGYDAYSYWSIHLADLYGRTFEGNFTLGAFRYTPPIAFLFAPLGALAWWLFLWLWLALMAACLAFLGGRWTLVLLALPPVALELYHGNVHLLMAVALAISFRHPWAWSFVVLTKLTPGVGLLWFVVRREWRSLAIAVGATAALAVATYVVAPHYWTEFVDATLSNLDQPQHFSVPPPLLIRLPLAALLVVWGARTDRPWTVPVGAAMALPIVWVHGLTVALAAIPFLRLGDRAATRPGWQDAANLRRVLLVGGATLVVALVVALVAGGPLRELLEWASANLAAEARRP